MQHNPLKRYIEQTEGRRSRSDWAALLGISRSYLCQILNDDRLPGRDAMMAISAGTEGAVTANDWMEYAPEFNRRWKERAAA